MFEIVLLLLTLLVVVWVYTIDRKKEAQPPVFNINVNIEGLDNGKTGTKNTMKTENREPKNSKKVAKEIPMETSIKEKSWKDIKITDSYNG